MLTTVKQTPVCNQWRMQSRKLSGLVHLILPLFLLLLSFLLSLSFFLSLLDSYKKIPRGLRGSMGIRPVGGLETP